MSDHETPSGSPEQREPAPEAPAPENEAPGADEGAPGAPTARPRDLAQRVWGSWPNLPAGAAPAAAPSPPGVVAPAGDPGPDLDLEEEGEERFDGDFLRVEERLRDTEDRLDSLAASMQQALRSLADTIHASTSDLPRVIEAVVERRVNAVGDALLKLADLRAKLQEETGEAVKGLRTSFQALEERLVETTQQRVEASIDRLVSEVREVREEIARTVATGNGPAEGIEARLRDRVAELPTRGDFASIRGAIGAVVSTLHDELGEAVQRIGRIEESLSSRPRGDADRPEEGPGDGRQAEGASEPPTSSEGTDERSVEDPFDGRPLFDFPER